MDEDEDDYKQPGENWCETLAPLFIVSAFMLICFAAYWADSARARERESGMGIAELWDAHLHELVPPPPLRNPPERESGPLPIPAANPPEQNPPTLGTDGTVSVYGRDDRLLHKVHSGVIHPSDAQELRPSGIHVGTSSNPVEDEESTSVFQVYVPIGDGPSGRPLPRNTVVDVRMSEAFREKYEIVGLEGWVSVPEANARMHPGPSWKVEPLQGSAFCSIQLSSLASRGEYTVELQIAPIARQVYSDAEEARRRFIKDCHAGLILMLDRTPATKDRP